MAIFGSSSAITGAQQEYHSWVSSIGCRCKGITVSTQPVTGLGDEAKALFLTPGPGADFITALSDNADPGTYLVVWSSNAVVVINYNISATGTETALAPSGGAAQLTRLIAVAHGVLAALARPAAVSSAPGVIAPVSAGRLPPHYAGRRDPCRLITAATLARYAPGTSVTPMPVSSTPGSAAGSAQLSLCSWGTTAPSPYIGLTLNVFPDAASAQQIFGTDLQGYAQGGSGTTVTGGQWLPDLGEQAAAVFQRRTGTDGAELLVLSGNVVIDFWYTGPGAQPPDRATLVAGGAAMARDALAALANPAASEYVQGPHYTSPRGACALIRASTLARYVPGATVSQRQADNTAGPQTSDCYWSGPNEFLTLTVAIYTDRDSAQGGFEFDAQFNHQNGPGATFISAQPVKDLGEEATATFQTSSGAPAVELDVWSGNAVIEINLSNLSNLPFEAPPMGHAAELAADIAIARDVLADLPR